MRTVSTSVFARLSGLMHSNSFQASIASPMRRKPAAVFRWTLLVTYMWDGMPRGADAQTFYFRPRTATWSFAG